MPVVPVPPAQSSGVEGCRWQRSSSDFALFGLALRISCKFGNSDLPFTCLFHVYCTWPWGVCRGCETLGSGRVFPYVYQTHTHTPTDTALRDLPLLSKHMPYCSRIIPVTSSECSRRRLPRFLGPVWRPRIAGFFDTIPTASALSAADANARCFI